MNMSKWWAKMSALLLLLLASSSGYLGVQAQEMTEGYYYISRTNGSGQSLFYSETDASNWRIKEDSYAPSNEPTKADAPYIFKVEKYGDGYSIMNYVNKKYWGRIPANGPGEGLGFVDTPVAMTLVYEATQLGWTVQNKNEAAQYYVMSWGDKYASYVASDNGTGNKYWDFTSIETEKVEAIESDKDVTEVTGEVEDGYYYMQFSKAGSGDNYVVPVNADGTWYLGALPLISTDNSFIFHITKLENGNYRIKNCGSQDLTYVESYTKGPAENVDIFMTGKKVTENTFTFYSNGTVCMFSTDNENNYRMNTTGKIENSKLRDANSYITLVPVSEDKITNDLKLTEAITDAKGGSYEVGTNPGQVSNAAYTEFQTALTAAENETAGADHTAAIAVLQAAIEKIEGEVIPVSDGYYRFINLSTNEFLAPIWATDGSTGWWYGHQTLDETDPSAIWHVYTNSEGHQVMKNCGLQDSTYILSTASGYTWAHLKMVGTSQTYQWFKQIKGNMFQIFGSDNELTHNAGTNNFITNNAAYYTSAFWYVEKVADGEITAFMKLNEAITDAGGVIGDANVGIDPGLNSGDPSGVQAVIAKAREAYNTGTASEAEIDALIAELKTAVEAFEAQDHSPVGVTEGYYYIVNAYSNFFTSQKEYKAWYGTSTTLNWAGLKEDDPRYIFKVSALTDSTYSIQNVQYSNYVSTSTLAENAVPMTATQEVAQIFTSLGGSQWNIANERNTTSYHAISHNSGNGAAGVVGFYAGGSGSASAWYLRKITDQEFIDSMITAGAQNMVTDDLKAALATAEPAWKSTFRYTSSHDAPLITEADNNDEEHCQFWASQEPSAKGDYSDYSNLIDGNTATCFQSTWSSGVASPPQPFQVDLREHPVQNFEFYFGLRDGSWGSMEQWTDITLYATNDETVASQRAFDFDASQWTKVGDYTDLPTDFETNGSNRGFYYQVRDMDQSYRYLRFMVNSTLVPQANMMYTIGEFQVYDLVYDAENSPYYYLDGMKDAVDALGSLIDNAKESIANNTATAEEVAALKAATQLVADLTPTTDAIESLLAEVKEYTGRFAAGDAWGDVTEEQWTEIQNQIVEAEGYDHEKPQRADLEASVQKLETAFATYKSQQKQFTPGQWYYMINTDASRTGNVTEGGTGDIWSTWTYGNLMYAPSNNTRAAHWDSNADAIIWGYYDHAAGARDDRTYTNPYCQWRIVVVDDSSEVKTYALQNRGTGLYIGTYANHNGRGGQNADPVPYTVSLLKSGQWSFVCADASNTDKRPLHASGDGAICSWEGAADSPSSWNLEEVPDASDIDQLEIQVPDNSIQIMTLPFAYDNEDYATFNADAGIKTYAVKGFSADSTQLYLTQKMTFEAGEPFIIITNKYENFDAENVATVPFTVPLYDEFTFEAKTANGLVGAIDYTLVGKSGFGYFNNAVLNATTSETSVQGHTGYLDPGAVVTQEGATDVTISIANPITGVNGVLATSSDASANVYTIDGKLVKKNVTSSKATQGLEKGLYIVGKKKISVK